MDRRHRRLTIHGLGLHLIEWGPENAPPIVMLHGIRGYAETFADVARALTPQYRVLAYDQRGRGQSDWDAQCQYYTDAYVADLREVADQCGLGRFDLLGHSMGGINAIVFAATYPQRMGRLIIEDAGPGAFEHSPGASRIKKELQETPASFATWEAACAFMQHLRPGVSEAARQQRLKNMLKPVPGLGYTWRYDHAGIMGTRLAPDPARQVDLARQVAAIACPTLLIRGSKTDYLQADMAAAMVAANKNFHMTEILGAGHYVHDDRPREFNQAVMDFLTAHPL